MERVVKDHLYLLDDVQLKHVIKLEEYWRTSSSDEEYTKCYELLKQRTAQRPAEGGDAVAEVMTERGVMFAVDNSLPFVLEHRRFGVVGNGYTAGPDYFNWFRGWYINHGDEEYGRDWRCWDKEPTDEERRSRLWNR